MIGTRNISGLQSAIAGSAQAEANGNLTAVPQLLSPFAKALGVYVIFVAFFWLVPSQLGGFRLMILNLGAAFTLAYFWKNVDWGEEKAYDCFGSILLLVAAAFRFQGAVDAIIFGDRLNDIPFTVPLPEDMAGLYLKADALSVVGTLIVAAVWRRAVGANVGQFSFLAASKGASRRVPTLIYLAAVVIAVLQPYFSEETGAFSLILSLLSNLGIVSIFFIARGASTSTIRVGLAAVLAVPFVATAASVGMKFAIILPLIPMIMLLWSEFRGVIARTSTIVIGIGLLFCSHLFVAYVRDISWTLGIQETSVELLGGFFRGGTGNDVFDNINAVSSRTNLTNTRVVTVAIADAKGFEPAIFANIPATLIPRVIWPNKPIIQPGGQQTMRVLDLNVDASEATTSTAAGFFSELYLGGGYIGWLIGVLLYGYMQARMQMFSLKNCSHSGRHVLSFVSALWALRFEEYHVAYAYVSIIFTGIAFYVLFPNTRSWSNRR